MFSRRRSKRQKQEIAKEFFLSILCIFLFLLLFLLSGLVYQTYLVRATFEKDVLAIASHNETPIFTVDRVFLFSSANASNNKTNKAFWDLNLYQYTDIAIYLNNGSDTLTSENTIKSLSIENIVFSTPPERGTPALYYKDLNNFGKPSFSEQTMIQDTISYTIVDTNQELDTTLPSLYHNGKTPITLEYVNKDIKNNTIIPNTNEALIFDGSLLKKAGITQNSIFCRLSFTIRLVNHLEQTFLLPITLSIPLEEEATNQSIFNGYVKKEIQVQPNTFYRL